MSPSPAPPRRKTKRRANANRTGIVAMSDLEVWSRSDQEILDATLPTWKSTVYAHYNVSIERRTHSTTLADGSIDPEAPDYIDFKFTCKTNPNHPPVCRRRDETKRGTGNLRSSMETCHKHAPPPTDSNTLVSSATVVYSYALHVAILILSCAVHYIPFARFADDLFRQQVELLRPGTSTPDSSTLSRDTQYVYREQARRVKAYFENIDTVHLAIDGWTSPTATAYLGLVVHWYSKGHLWRAVLEFIRMEQKHTGAYIASKAHECLERYGLGQKFLSVCLDNAGNNDTLVRHLAELAPHFRGPLSRVRCAPHIINLMVKAFIEHFVRPSPKKRKAVKYKKSNKRRRVELPVSRVDSLESNSNELVEYVIEAGDAENSSDIEDDSVAAMVEAGLDEDKALHDQYVIKETTTEALQYARQTLKLSITNAVQVMARGVLSKASALAKKLHKTATLQSKFEILIDRARDQLQTLRRALARRVPTRWNSDYECLLSLLELKPCVEMLTADSANGLQHLALDEAQWNILEQLLRVLRIFKRASDLFSKAEVPLAHEVVPVFVSMRRKLEVVRDDSKRQGLHPLIRTAAHSALLVYEKYMDSFADSEVYWIALVMCPQRKLQWLHDNGFSAAQIDSVCKLVINRFNTSYKRTHSGMEEMAMVDPQDDSDASEDEWSPENEPSTPSDDTSSIENYLRSEPIHRRIVKKAGGPLGYWQSQQPLIACPELAQFAIDYLSAPASSVDTERAFSCGRLMTNHLQHQMSTDTFKAKMALHSWYKTPLLPDVSDVASLLADHNPEQSSEN